jgi:hypothetical protein
MKTAFVVAAAVAATAATAALAVSPMEGFKGKMKPGMYAYKIDMDMGQIPGMPPGMGKQSFNMQHCVTAQDMEKGQLGKGRQDQGPQNCEMKDFRMSGNTATYRMVCKGHDGQGGMTADNTVTFQSDGFAMNMKMVMDREGQRMNMNQHMEAKYLGPCSK